MLQSYVAIYRDNGTTTTSPIWISVGYVFTKGIFIV